MIPKDKATWLFEKYLRLVSWSENYTEMANSAKQCCNILIDEIESELKIYESAIIYKGYWSKVREELNKL